MPVVAAVLLAWGRILRRPVDVRLKQRHVGPSAVVLLCSAVYLTWDRCRPGGFAATYFYGELAGVLGICLLSCSLLLATRARWMERWFGGLDRVYLWHKRTAIAAVPLLLPHALITGRPPHTTPSRFGLALGVASMVGLLGLIVISLPRIGRLLHVSYERWLFVHRLTGLFVVLGVLHGLTVDRVIATSRPLWIFFASIGALGTLSYAYAEILMRRREPSAPYTIARVDRPSPQVVELGLSPVADPILPTAGQFVYLRIGGDGAWREHPFSVAGTEPVGRLRLTVTANGPDTRLMHTALRPGMPATISGPYGMFDYTLGSPDQLWIAGGIGVAPFLSWLHALSPSDRYSVDLFYSVPTERQAIYLPELEAAGARLPGLRVHPVFSRTQGRLNGKAITAAIGPLPPGTDVFLCGPGGMLRTLNRDLHRQGVPRDHIHFEHFAFR